MAPGSKFLLKSKRVNEFANSKGWMPMTEPINPTTYLSRALNDGQAEEGWQQAKVDFEVAILGKG